MDVVGDRISELPDDLLQNVLFFMSAREVVRTCMLSPRWRDLWASLRHIILNTVGFSSGDEFVKFVNNLLLRRGHTPLDALSLCAIGPDIFLDNFSEAANLWIYHALRCNVRELTIVDHPLWDRDLSDVIMWPIPFSPDRCSFVSSNLRRLHLCGLEVNSGLVNQIFSSCTKLEDLEIINCMISATKFSSAILKNLRIEYFDYPEGYYGYYDDIVINMPSLVYLCIGGLLCKMPLLVDVQSLVSAWVSLYHESLTFADCCQVLGALSNINNLCLAFPCFKGAEELSGDETPRCLGVFTNLVTLNLDDWCLHGGCRVLLYVLKHSPNLEILRIKLYPEKNKAVFLSEWLLPNDALERTPLCKEPDTPFVCKNLKAIIVDCGQYDDERVNIIREVLRANNFPVVVSYI